MSQISNLLTDSSTPVKDKEEEEEKSDKKKKTYMIPAFFNTKKDKDKENIENDDMTIRSARTKTKSEKNTLVKVQRPKEKKPVNHGEESPTSKPNQFETRKPITRSATISSRSEKPVKKTPLVVTTQRKLQDSLQIDRLPLEKIRPLESPRLVTTPFLTSRPRTEKPDLQTAADMQLIEELDKVLDSILIETHKEGMNESL